MKGLDVLILRGAPGVGKSTLGRGLRRQLDHGSIIEVDDIRGMLARVDWTSRVHHDIALSVALDSLLSFLRVEVRPVVLIDTFSRSRLHGVQSRLNEAELRHHTLSLWLEPELLAARLRERKSGFCDWESSRVLNEEARTNRYPNEEFIDTTRMTPEDVLAVAQRRLDQHAKALVS